MQTINSIQNPIKIYDERHDILCVIFGDNSSSYEDDTELGFGLIRDMDSDTVVGITCYGYAAKSRRQKLIDMLEIYGITADL